METREEPTAPAELPDSWNYRVLQDEHFSFAIREVYYRDGKPIGIGDPAAPYGENLAELHKDSVNVMLALARPTLQVQGDNLVEVES